MGNLGDGAILKVGIAVTCKKLTYTGFWVFNGVNGLFLFGQSLLMQFHVSYIDGVMVLNKS